MKRTKKLQLIILCIFNPLMFTVFLLKEVPLWMILISLFLTSLMLIGIFALVKYLFVKIGIPFRE